MRLWLLLIISITSCVFHDVLSEDVDESDRNQHLIPTSSKTLSASNAASNSTIDPTSSVTAILSNSSHTSNSVSVSSALNDATSRRPILKTNNPSVTQSLESRTTLQPNNKSPTTEKKIEVPDRTHEDEVKDKAAVSSTTLSTTQSSSTASVATSTITSTKKSVESSLNKEQAPDSGLNVGEEDKAFKISSEMENEKLGDYGSPTLNKQQENPKFPNKFTESPSGGNGNFFIFACISLAACILLYLAYQSRSKILGYLIEGKRPSRSRMRQSSSSRDRSKVAYRPLNENASEPAKDFIY